MLSEAKPKKTIPKDNLEEALELLEKSVGSIKESPKKISEEEIWKIFLKRNKLVDG